ncbi:PDZ domain-containing protein [candidate division KSB1 bacterium]|nr:PDZ domain-containing protein [candidate division KSB1 bacterium]
MKPLKIRPVPVGFILLIFLAVGPGYGQGMGAYAAVGDGDKVGWLGVYLDNLTPEIKESLDYGGKYGVLVEEVAKDSPAEEAGIEDGDIIVEWDGKTVKNIYKLKRWIREGKAGDKMTVKIFRDGEEKVLEVEVGGRPWGPPGLGFFRWGPEGFFEMAKEERAWLGVRLQDLTDQLGKYFGVKDGKGALISEVLEDSPAEEAGLKAGDVVIQWDDEKIEDAQGLRSWVREAGVGDEITLLVKRNRKKKKFKVKLAEAPEKYKTWDFPIFGPQKWKYFYYPDYPERKGPFRWYYRWGPDCEEEDFDL